MTLGRFFDFREFWEKRHEFVKSVDPTIFFNPGSPAQLKLYEVVKLWIGKSLDPAKGSVGPDKVTYGTLNLKLNKTYGHLGFLERLKPEDAIGITCLYEMIGRHLKQDIPEIAGTLRTDFVDWSSDVVKVSQSGVVELPVASGNVDVTGNLRSVLIVNPNTDGQTVTLSFGTKATRLRPHECCRALFIDSLCVGVLPNRTSQGKHEYCLKLTEDGRSILENNGTSIMESGNILSYSVNPSHPYRYVYANDKGRIISADPDIDDFDIRTSLPKGEKPVHLVIGAFGELYILTSGKKLFMYTPAKGLAAVDVKEAVVMIDTDNRGNLKTVKISEIKK